MIGINNLRTAMLAAASIAAIGIAGPAAAGVAAESVAIEHIAAADHVETEARAADKAVNRWLLGGAVSAALAGLIGLFGWARISEALRKAADMAIEAPAAAARAVAEAIKSPVRTLMIVGGLSLFALTGIGFYDVEWAAGLLTGAALTLAGLVGMRRMGQFFVRR